MLPGPGRQLLLHGTLTTWTLRREAAMEWMLFTDILVYALPRKGHQLVYKGLLYLPDVDVIDMPYRETLHEWSLAMGAQRFKLASTELKVKLEWVAALRSAQANMRSSRVFGVHLGDVQRSRSPFGPIPTMAKLLLTHLQAQGEDGRGEEAE